MSVPYVSGPDILDLTLGLTPDCILKLMGSASLQIGQVARRTGLSIDAIRFYEKSGLLPQPCRPNGGYRLYNQQEIRDLEFIQKAPYNRELSCDQIADMSPYLRGVELQTMERGLAGALRHCKNVLREPPQHDDSCPVLKQITRRQTKGRKA